MHYQWRFNHIAIIFQIECVRNLDLKKIYLPRVNFSSTILNASRKNLNSGLTTLLLINVYFPTPKYSDVYVYNVAAS